MKSLSKEHSTVVLKKMFEAVGQEYDEELLTKPNWYWTYTWTEDEQEKFIGWLGKFLVKNKYVRKGKKRGQDAGYYEASKMVFNYGWKVKDTDLGNRFVYDKDEVTIKK